MVPELDHVMATLLDDLKDRGLLESTLIITLAEFGRTPGINAEPGPRPLRHRLEHHAHGLRRQGRRGLRQDRPDRQPRRRGRSRRGPAVRHHLPGARHQPAQELLRRLPAGSADRTRARSRSRKCWRSSDVGNELQEEQSSRWRKQPNPGQSSRSVMAANPGKLSQGHGHGLKAIAFAVAHAQHRPAVPRRLRLQGLRDRPVRRRSPSSKELGSHQELRHRRRPGRQAARLRRLRRPAHLVGRRKASKDPRHRRAHRNGFARSSRRRTASYVASVADDMVCRLWDAETGKLVHELRGHKEKTPHALPVDALRLLPSRPTASIWRRRTRSAMSSSGTSPRASR